MTSRMLITIVVCLVAAGAAKAAQGPADLRYFDSDDRTGSSRMVMVNDVPLVHTTQLMALDAKGEIAGAGSVGAQAGIVLDHLAALFPANCTGMRRASDDRHKANIGQKAAMNRRTPKFVSLVES